MSNVERCIDQPCPFYGYTDTKKCWYHSQGLPLPDSLPAPELIPEAWAGTETFAEVFEEVVEKKEK